VRVIRDTATCTSVAIHPSNSNIFVVGTEKGLVKTFNMSTGKPVEKVRVADHVTSMTFSDKGDLLFVGDKKGIVYTFIWNPAGTMKLIAKVQVAAKGSVNSLTFKTMLHTSQKKVPFLLISCNDNTASLFRLETKPTKGSNLVLEKQMAVPNRRENVRSRFCPLIGGGPAELCMVSGGEDSCVHIYDALRDVPLEVNKLQGHSGMVYDVSWNCDETLLASCDLTGMVILWKRVKNVGTQ